jgi:hypothetical protein
LGRSGADEWQKVQVAAAAPVAALRKAVVGRPKVAAKGGEAKRVPTKARTQAEGARRLQAYQATAKHLVGRRNQRQELDLDMVSRSIMEPAKKLEFP